MKQAPATTLAAIAVLTLAALLPSAAHELEDDTRRIAVVSAFAPEMSILREATEGAAAYSINGVRFIAVRSLSDLAGGSGHANQLEVFFRLAAGNAAAVVRALLRAMPD